VLHRFFFRYKPASCVDAGDEGADEYESPMSQPWRQPQRIIAEVSIAGLPATEGEMLKAQVALSTEALARAADARLSYQWLCDGVAVPGAMSADFRAVDIPLGSVLSVSVSAALDSSIHTDVVAKANPLLPAKPVCSKFLLQCGPEHSVPVVAVPQYSGGVEGPSTFRWFRIPVDPSTGSPSPNKLPLPCSTSRYQPTCDDISCIIGCEYTPVRVDGVQGSPVQAVIPQAVTCDPRVLNRVNTHLKEGSAGFHLNILNDSGQLLPRKLAITPVQITVLSPPAAGLPASSVSYPITQQTAVALVAGDLQVSLYFFSNCSRISRDDESTRIPNFLIPFSPTAIDAHHQDRHGATTPPCPTSSARAFSLHQLLYVISNQFFQVLTLLSENHLKRDVLVMVLRQWM
jgi:hypothetical protein